MLKLRPKLTISENKDIDYNKFSRNLLNFIRIISSLLTNKYINILVPKRWLLKVKYLLYICLHIFYLPSLTFPEPKNQLCNPFCRHTNSPVLSRSQPKKKPTNSHGPRQNPRPDTSYITTFTHNRANKKGIQKSGGKE